MGSFKDQGNEAFKAENYLRAAALYTQAIKEDPENAVLFSNRSAALLKLKKVTKAMEDADKCVALKPDWEKGYFRRAAVLEELGKLQEALEVYQHASQLSKDQASASAKELNIKIRTLQKVLKMNTAKQQKEETLESLLASAAGGAADGPIPAFCREMAASAMERIASDGAVFAPSLHFLPGPNAEAHEEQETHIQAMHGFVAPEVYGEFVQHMRATGERLDAQAVVAVVPRGAIAFPSVWAKKGWPVSKQQQTGVFVQVEVKGGASRAAWYLPVADKSLQGRPVSIQAEDFGPLPSLLK